MLQTSGLAHKVRAVRKHALSMFAAACVFGACDAFAKPFIPDTADTVVAEIPTADMRARSARALQRVARQRPQDLSLAVQAAEASLALGLAEADPRYAGHAEAVLAPWWTQAAPPVQVRLLRAAILQGRHEFDAALADLDAVIAGEPRHAQALLTRAVIRQVQGKFADARVDCVDLSRRDPGLAATTCAALIDSLTGASEEALTTLEAATASSKDSREVRLWALTVMAETAERIGQADQAERSYRAALALGVKDGYLTTAWADFLLGQNRPQEVVDLLKDSTAIDPFMLRLTEAERRLDLPVWRAHADDLAQRFADAAQRGDVVHRREESRFRLHLRDDAPGALRLAQANWAVQREPADALILLEAAAAADKAAAQPVIAWAEGNALQDVRIDAVAHKIRDTATP